MLTEPGVALTSDELPFRFLAENLPTPCWISDEEGRIVWVNAAWIAYTGLDVAGIERDGLASIHDPAVYPEVVRVWNETKRDGAANEMTFPLRGRDGQFRRFLTRVVPIKDAGGAVTRWFGTNTDVTDLATSRREEWREVFESAAEGIFLADSDDRFIDVNPAGCELVGYAREELLRLRNTDLVEPMDAKRARSIGAHASGGPAARGEFRLRRKDGALVDVEISARVLSDNRRLAIVHEITARKQAHAALLASEARFRELAETAPVMIWQIDLHGAPTYVNGEVRRFHGLAPDAAAPSLLSVVHPDDVEASRQVFASAVAAQAPFSHEARGLRWDGQWRWLRVEATVQHDDAGAPVSYLACIADVTDSKAAEERLARRVGEAQLRAEDAERQLQRFWDASKDMFAIVDRGDGVPRSINAAAWEATLGYPAEQILSRQLVELIHPDDLQRTLDIDRDYAGQRAVFGFENRYRRADGRWVWLSWNVVREEGVSFCIARDVTEERARAEALARNQRLEALGQLTGGVAHDFNNLLTTILGSLDLMQRRPDDGALRERLTMAALGAVRRGEQLNKQLLSFARGHPAGAAAGVDVYKLILDMKPLLESALGGDIALELDLAPDMTGCMIDASQLEAALLNLVVNARDAMPDGGALTLRTRVAAADDPALADVAAGDFGLVEVIDNGCGMSADTKAHVFEPFFTTKDVGRGVGLGLAQVYGAVRHAGGVTTLESELGAGTTVRLYLRRMSLARPAEAAERVWAPTGERVLLVEDDPLVGIVTETLLAEMGYEVTRCERAVDALAALSRDGFQILVTDVRMPGGLNGLELAKAAQARRPTLKVLLCSGWMKDAPGAEAPPWPLLPKPFDGPQLRRALGEL